MRLNREFLPRIDPQSARLVVGSISSGPERVLQFGEGNFLRAFVDWMVNVSNAQGRFAGRVVVVQPLERGTVSALNEQDGLYTCLLRGLQGGAVVERRELVTCISRGINPYQDWPGFLETAGQPALRFVVSNTTEAGIAYVEEPPPRDACPASFPAKVAAWLHERFRRLGGEAASGMTFLPCELIDKNGEALRACVLQHATAWGLGREFAGWVTTHNRFLNTLVDRIVPGYPQDEAATLAAELGYEDRLLTTAEIFHVWVIEGKAEIARELPVDQAGCNVIWTDDLTPYRTRKVRILNGAHTMSALPAYLAGLTTVRECVEDPRLGSYLRRGIFEEILPLLPPPQEETRAFAESVLERLGNPFIHHNLLSIALNSVSKYRVRVLPSLLAYQRARRRLPPALTFSLAALLAFYRGTDIRDGALVGARDGAPYLVRDDAAVLQAFADRWRAYERQPDPASLSRALLARTDLWGQDLTRIPDLAADVTANLARILRAGVHEALGSLG